MDSLDYREFKCCKEAAYGKSDHEIADLLNISKWLVRCALYSAYKKLGINRRQHLPKLFFCEHNWLQLTGCFYRDLYYQRLSSNPEYYNLKAMSKILGVEE